MHKKYAYFGLFLCIMCINFDQSNLNHSACQELFCTENFHPPCPPAQKARQAPVTGACLVITQWLAKRYSAIIVGVESSTLIASKPFSLIMF